MFLSKAKITTFPTEWTVRLPTAFLISILLHTVILLALAFWLKPISTLPLSNLNLILAVEALPDANTKAIEPIQPTPATTSESVPQKSELPVETPPPISNASIMASEVTKPNDLPLCSTNLDCTMRSNTVRWPSRTDGVPPKFVPVIPISPEQQKFLIKKTNEFIEKLHQCERNDSLFTCTHKKQLYQVKISRKVATQNTDLDEVVCEVMTREDGDTLITTMRLKRLAFSNYAQFIDYWDPQVALHKDQFFGRFHTNSTFNISKYRGEAPQFQGPVTTASFQIKLDRDFLFIDRPSIFKGGIERGVKEIRLPRNFGPFSNAAPINAGQVHSLSETTWITFQRDGSYLWRTKSLRHKEYRQKISPEKAFFIIGEKGAHLHVKGEVKGKVLVYSAENIIIENDLVFAEEPSATAGNNNYLGLVSQKDIKIAHPKITGPGDLHIQAAIHAHHRFEVTHLYGAGEATLHIFGSLSAGSLSATEPRYATHIVFDPRLESVRPPHFPLTDHYELFSWNRLWKIQ